MVSQQPAHLVDGSLRPRIPCLRRHERTVAKGLPENFDDPLSVLTKQKRLGDLTEGDIVERLNLVFVKTVTSKEEPCITTHAGVGCYTADRNNIGHMGCSFSVVAIHSYPKPLVGYMRDPNQAVQKCI